MSEPNEVEPTGADGSRWAVGGPVQGPGGKDSDSIPVWRDNSYALSKAELETISGRPSLWGRPGYERLWLGTWTDTEPDSGETPLE